MAYVEWLRVKKTLIVLAIVLGALFLIAAIVRVSVNGQMNPDTWIKMAGSQAHVTTRILPDGATETTVVDPNTGSSTVMTDHGWYGKRIVATSRTETRDGDLKRPFAAGPLRVQRIGPKTVAITTDEPIDIGLIFLGVTLVGMIIATCLAAPLARENDRLEVAWTKPIDRTLYGLQLYGVDVVGIVASIVMMVVWAIACYALFQMPYLTLTGSGAWMIATSLVGCTAWYAMFAAMTSWMKRGHGAFLGIAWPVGLIVPGLALIYLDFNAVGQMFHWVFKIVASIDPLAYVSLEIGPHRVAGFEGLDPVIKVSVLATLAIVYAAAGLIEWQRVEA